MYVNIVFLKEIGLDLIFSRNGADETYSRHGGFFHYITHLARKFHISFAGHDVDFDLKGITAYGRPGQTSGNTDLVGLKFGFAPVFFFAEKIRKIFARNGNLFDLFFKDLSGSFAADLSDLSLQFSDSRFSCVKRNDLFQSRIVYGKFLF
jgi:hypothetical protein